MERENDADDIPPQRLALETCPAQQIADKVDERNADAVHQAPDDERPARAMPQPAERHRDDDVERLVRSRPSRLPPSGMYR